MADRLSAVDRIDWTSRLARRTAGQNGVIGGILALANASGVINFTGGFPDPEVFPTDSLAPIVDRLLTTDFEIALQYAPSEGIASTRDTFGELLLRREGIRPGPGELMVTSGGIDAITLASVALRATSIAHSSSPRSSCLIVSKSVHSLAALMAADRDACAS